MGLALAVLDDRRHDALEVNKKELAKLLSVSLPTLDKLIDRYPDFPIAERGQNGVGYKFRVAEVVPFLRERREVEERAAVERMSLLDELDLGLDPATPSRTGALTPAQKLATVRAERERRKLFAEAGFLVDVSELRHVLTGTLQHLARALDGLPNRLQRRFNLPVEVADAMRAEIEEIRRALHKELTSLVAQDDGHDGRDGTDA